MNPDRGPGFRPAGYRGGAAIRDVFVFLSAGTGLAAALTDRLVDNREIADAPGSEIVTYCAAGASQPVATELVVITLTDGARDASQARRPFEQFLDSSPASVMGGHYKLLRTFGQQKARDSTVRGILAVFAERVATVPEDVFETWYDTHVLELLATGYYQSAYRLKAVSGSLPTYLAIYETNADPGRAADALTEMRDRWSFPTDYGDPTDVKIRGVFLKQQSTDDEEKPQTPTS